VLVVIGLFARRRSVLVVAFAVSALAIARADGFDAQLYQATTSSSGYVSQDGANVLPSGVLDVGATLDFAHDPLVLRDASTGEQLMDGGVVANRLGLTITSGFGLTKWLEVGLAVPVVLAQNGDLGLITNDQLATTTLGDIRGFAKARIFHRDRVAIAGALDVTVPSGNAESFTGGNTASARPRLIAGWQDERWSAALNVGFRFRGESRVVNVVVDDELTTGAGAAFALVPERVWLIGEAYVAIGVFGDAHAVPAEVLIGARAKLSRSWQGQLALGEGLGRGYGTPAFQSIAAMSYSAALIDESKPRPVAPRDTDRDGLVDSVDKCPTEPEDKDGFEDTDGCPELDNDGDGIVDATDRCPLEPEDKDGFQDDDGCPDADNDADGIADAKDSCPLEPEDKDNFKDDDGCPDPDNDGDGIPDTKDACPNDPETKNGYDDDNGCPDELPDKLMKFVGVLVGVNFKVGSATLLGTSSKALDAAVAVLVEFPDLKLEIQGHTDDQALRKNSQFADNEALAKARAEAVESYLIVNGIAADRLRANGYGASRPLVDPAGLKGAKLRAARAKNRRVQLEIIVAPLPIVAPPPTATPPTATPPTATPPTATPPTATLPTATPPTATPPTATSPRSD